MIKILSIKILVSIANILLYTALMLIFLILGLKKWNITKLTIYKVCYILIIFSIIIFITYHLIRIYELKKTTFQLLIKHIIFMYFFYIGQYIIFIISLFFLFLINIKILNSLQICIFWYIWFPTVFFITIFCSLLESIVRIEEKIFIIKKKWINLK